MSFVLPSRSPCNLRFAFQCQRDRIDHAFFGKFEGNRSCHQVAAWINVPHIHTVKIDVEILDELSEHDGVNMTIFPEKTKAFPKNNRVHNATTNTMKSVWCWFFGALLFHWWTAAYGVRTGCVPIWTRLHETHFGMRVATSSCDLIGSEVDWYSISATTGTG